MRGLVRKLYDKKISSKGLAVFRMFFAMALFLDVLFIFKFRQLYFDPIPFLEPVDGILYSVLLFWLLVLIALFFGIVTRIASILSYVCAVYILNSVGSFEYHMDKIYLAVGFLIIFIPLNKTYSVDAIIKSRIFTKKLPDDKKNVSVLYYYLIVMVGITFIYFDSTLFKIKSDVWLNGLGLWLPASLPAFTILNDQWFLNQEYLMKSLGFLTLVFEVSFPFLFFFKKFRLLIFAIGFGLHLGILLEFPIPYFAVGILSVYMLLIPVGYWDKAERFLTNNLRLLSLTRIPQNFTVIKSDNFNYQIPERFQIAGFKFLFFGLIILQLNSSFNFPFSEGLVIAMPTHNTTINCALEMGQKQKKKLRIFSKKYMGIAAHGVFIDGHFMGYHTYYTATYNGKLLPMTDVYGMPASYLMSGTWADFNFRVNKPYQDTISKNLERGLARYTSFWAYKNGVDLNEAKFKIVKKEISVPFKWEKDLLYKNRMMPWETAGELVWKDKKASLNLTEIE